MFRDCEFEYAGVSSNTYNLKLYYLTDTISNLGSGGEYEPKTDVLPKSPEQFLYGLDYSSAPLEFDIEIINPDRAIPHRQLIEIKNWLFGQNGWKTFRTLDEMQDYHLKCLLIPEEDIVDGLGYRGFKCKLRNASAFWYGNKKTIEFDYAYLNDSKRQTLEYIVGSSDNGISYWTPFEINIDNNSMSCDEIDILPDIQVSVQSIAGETAEGVGGFGLGTTKYSSVAEFVKEYESKQVQGSVGVAPGFYSGDVTSAIHFGIDKITSPHTWDISTKYITINRGDWSKDTDRLQVGTRAFRLKKGKNICYITIPNAITNIVFSYTPLYRIGAF